MRSLAVGCPMDPHNPYAAPAEPPGADPAASRQAPLPLAPRLARFGGAVIDALFNWGVHLAALTAVSLLFRKTALFPAGWISRPRTIDLLAFAGASSAPPADAATTSWRTPAW